MSYEVGFKPSALREVRKLDEVTRKAIISGHRRDIYR